MSINSLINPAPTALRTTPRAADAVPSRSILGALRKSTRSLLLAGIATAGSLGSGCGNDAYQGECAGNSLCVTAKIDGDAEMLKPDMAGMLTGDMVMDMDGGTISPDASDGGMPEDLAMKDLAGDMAMMSPPDLSMPDQTMPDDMNKLPEIDMAMPTGDMAMMSPPDTAMSPNDLSMMPPVDLSMNDTSMMPPPDTAMSPNDLSMPPDLTKPQDLAMPPDLKLPPDLSQPPDMAQKPCYVWAVFKGWPNTSYVTGAPQNGTCQDTFPEPKNVQQWTSGTDYFLWTSQGKPGKLAFDTGVQVGPIEYGLYDADQSQPKQPTPPTINDSIAIYNWLKLNGNGGNGNSAKLPLFEITPLPAPHTIFHIKKP